MGDTTKEIKDKYARLRADQHYDKTHQDRIDEGRFNNYEPGSDVRSYWNGYSKQWYNNSEPIGSLFRETAQQTLNDKELMRQLRREYRQERRDFRRNEREDYRKRKDV